MFPAAFPLQADVKAVVAAAKALNPTATCYITSSEVTVTDPNMITGKRVLCMDDGPTITHGGMSSGAAVVAAKKYGAKEVVDPRGKFVGEMKETFEKYPHIGPVVPAMGYDEQQVGGWEMWRITGGKGEDGGQEGGGQVHSGVGRVIRGGREGSREGRWESWKGLGCRLGQGRAGRGGGGQRRRRGLEALGGWMG